MEIFVNGQPGVASTDDDVRLGDLFEYLQREFIRQRLLVRAYTLDGTEVFPDERDDKLLGDTPKGHSKLELDVAPFEVVAFDVLAELVKNVPSLSEEAVKITEELQTSQFAAAQERFVRFTNTTGYVSQAMSSVSTLLGMDLEKLMGGTTLQEDMQKLGQHLKEVEIALNEKDYTTVGDIMEFDVAPSVRSLTDLLGVMLSDIESRMADQGMDGADAAAERFATEGGDGDDAGLSGGFGRIGGETPKA